MEPKRRIPKIRNGSKLKSASSEHEFCREVSVYLRQAEMADPGQVFRVFKELQYGTAFKYYARRKTSSKAMACFLEEVGVAFIVAETKDQWHPKGIARSNKRLASLTSEMVKALNSPDVGRLYNEFLAEERKTISKKIEISCWPAGPFHKYILRILEVFGAQVLLRQAEIEDDVWQPSDVKSHFNHSIAISRITDAAKRHLGSTARTLICRIMTSKEANRIFQGISTTAIEKAVRRNK